MAKRLTETAIRKLSVPKTAPTWVRDTVATGLALKVTPKGKRLFVMHTVYPGQKTQATRTLGEYHEKTFSLTDARAKAEQWRAWIKADIDPSVEEAKRSEAKAKAEMLAEERSFGAVANAYIERGLKGQRWGHRVKRQIEQELIPAWGTKPIGEITRLDVVALIEPIQKRGPSYAHNILDAIRGLFSWAIEQSKYGLEHSPCDRIRRAKLIGKKKKRTRVLNNAELVAVWRATDTLGYPYGPLVKMLMLTGAREDEVAGARWREIDLVNKTWTVPEQRFKSEFPHLVTLSDDAITLLDGLPRWKADCLFCASRVNAKGKAVPIKPGADESPDGKNPVGSFSKAKARIDKHIKKHSGDVPHWIFHDLRRTVRTRLSALKVEPQVAEMIVGHGKKGLARVYDQHEYLDEMREGLDAWAALLKSIVEPTPTATNVVTLAPKRARRA